MQQGGPDSWPVSVTGPQNVLAVAERVIMIAGWRCLEVEALNPYAAKKLPSWLSLCLRFEVRPATQARDSAALEGGRL